MKPLAAYKLPVPPSANRMYRSVRGRAIKSEDYRAWIEEAGFELLRQRVVAIPRPFAVRIVLMGGRDWNWQRDCDNCIKPLVDLLRAAGVIQNDSSRHMVDVSARIEEHDGERSWVCIEVESLKG